MVGTLIDGKPLFCGGYDGSDSFSSCYWYDVKSNQWTPGPEMRERRDDAAAVMINETHWWVTGGYKKGKEISAVV